MKCDYCGQFIKLYKENSNQKNDCIHDLDKFLEQYSEQREQAFQISQLIQKQMESIKYIDNKFETKLDLIIKQIQTIEEEQKNNLREKKKFLDNFEEIFDKLKYIDIKQELQYYFKDNIQDYFERNQVFQWVTYCQKEIIRIENSLNNFQIEFQQIKQQKLEQFRQQKLQNKDQIEILLMTFNIFHEKNIQDESKIQSFMNELKSQHQNLINFLIKKQENKRLFLKQLKKLFQRHRTIQKDILQDFFQNFRILESFENFESNFNVCIQEIKARNKFKYYYSNFLEILNVMTQKENQRRIQFIKKISNKIPDQIFPFLKELVRQLNINKIISSLDSGLPKFKSENLFQQNTQQLKDQFNEIFFNQQFNYYQLYKDVLNLSEIYQKNKLKNYQKTIIKSSVNLNLLIIQYPIKS